MNIHRKFSQVDVSGVMGLLAFLADKDACAARLSELLGMVAAADAEIAKAADAVSKAAGMTAEAEKMRGEVEAAKASFGEKLAAVEARELTVAAAVADGKSMHAREGNRLAAWENDLEQRETTIGVHGAALAQREAVLAAAEAQVAALRADYEDKLAKFKALAA